jgi:hypothetical protein
MAFDQTKLGRVTSSGNSGHPTVWSYNSGADLIAAVVAADYFAGAKDVAVGDIIMCVTDSKAKLTTVVLTALTSTTSTVVKTA